VTAENFISQHHRLTHEKPLRPEKMSDLPRYFSGLRGMLSWAAHLLRSVFVGKAAKAVSQAFETILKYEPWPRNE
jgi:hypothetical protein